MPRFTPQNAREMAVRSLESRRERKSKREDASAFPHPTPQETAPDPNYVARRLARVREQLDRVDCMMMKEKDPQKLDRLASAQARLAEQERILDGRPLPGSRRLAVERTPRHHFTPIE